MTLCLSKNEMCTCLVVLETSISGLSVWEGSGGKRIRTPHMGAFEFLYEGNMNAVATEVYDG